MYSENIPKALPLNPTYVHQLVEQANSEFMDEMIQIMQSFSDRDYFFALDEMKKIFTISKGEQGAEDEIAAFRRVVGR